MVPDWLLPVLLSPEVQRLRGVRLINTTSPSCAALSDVRRFTHSVGVYFLASRLAERISGHCPQEQLRAFLVASLVHDIGTPPFGHLFEYQLSLSTGWHHERVVSDVIRGNYRPERRYHQIYYANALRLHHVLKENRVDAELVMAMVRGEGELGRLLTGSIDLDNIDTVFRMASLLGLLPDRKTPLDLADSVAIEPCGIVYSEAALPLVDTWRQLRRQVYEVLVFDNWCLSGQAMLTQCLVAALERKLLGEEHWFLTDEGLLDRLFEHDEIKESIRRFSAGDYFDVLFVGWYAGPRKGPDLRHPSARRQISRALTERTGLPCCPYVFYDHGAFSKKLVLNVATASGTSTVTIGATSESTVVAITTPHRIRNERRSLVGHVLEVLEDNGLARSSLLRIPEKEDIYELPRQGKLPF